MTNEERKNYCMRKNVKRSPLLIALTWDIIFFWTISTLFFTTQKGLSYSQVISLDSIVMFLGCILCVPINRLFQNVTPINSTRVGLLGYAGYVLLCIIGTNFATFVLAQFFLAFGYAIMSVKVNSVLTQSLHVLSKEKDYEKVYGNGLSIYYIINCVGSILITYVYNWQPYVAAWSAFVVIVFAEIYTLFFKDVSKFQERNVNLNNEVPASTQTTKKPDGYLKILKSSFFIFLLLFMFMMRGVLSITSSSYKVYLQQLIDVGAVPIWIFGYLYAGSRLCAALASKFQFKFNLKFGVRSIVILVFGTIILFVAPALLYMQNSTSIINIVLITILCYLQMSIYVICRIFVNNYMQVCIKKKNAERAYSIRTMVEYLGYAAISAVFAWLLSAFGNDWGITNLVYIAIFTIPLIVFMVLFVRALCKKYAQKYTIIKDEYTKD